MNREDIIAMAQEAGGFLGEVPRGDAWMFTEEGHLERFAALVASAEREACAELVWPKLKVWSKEEQTAMGLAFNKAQEKHGWYETLMAVGASVLKIKAEAIRARGNVATNDTSQERVDKTSKSVHEPVAWGVFEGNLHDMFFTEVEAVEMAQLKGNHAEVKPLYTKEST
jgi:hypothetical protein